MKVPVEWLREFVPVRMKPAVLAERLTMIGLEVGSIEEVAGRTVLDVEVTSNRGDCLSMIGVARETAAMCGRRLEVPGPGAVRGDVPGGSSFPVDIEDPELCPRYAARLIEGVRLGPSPRWLAERLEATGLRPLNNIVDATNYVLMERGHPLHAFDADTLLDERILVRRARPGEVITTIDGIDRELTQDMLVIADGRRPVALAGIMGGHDTEVSSGTTRVLLESACFTPSNVRRTVRRLGMQTEASYRFERGTDIEGVMVALDRASGLIAELSGGVVAGTSDNYPGEYSERVVGLRPKRVRQVLGIRVSSKIICSILDRLGFGIHEPVAGGDLLQVIVPSYRNDVEREIDLVEEVARHYGYERIQPTVARGAIMPTAASPRRRAAEVVREVLVAGGFLEVVNTSFVAGDVAGFLGTGAAAAAPVTILNPMNETHAQMRTSLVPGLLGSAAHNVSRGSGDLQLFEIGRVYFTSGGSAQAESLRAAALMMGRQGGEGWGDRSGQVDFYSAKGAAEAVLARLRVAGAAFDETERPFLEKGARARITVSGEEIGVLGAVAGTLKARFDITDDVYVFEMDLGRASELMEAVGRIRALPRFPSSRRDLAVIVAEEVRASDLLEAVYASAGECVEDVVLFDVYQGEQVPAGRKSLAFAVHYRSRHRTLTDEEITAAHTKVSDELAARFGARTRSG